MRTHSTHPQTCIHTNTLYMYTNMLTVYHTCTHSTHEHVHTNMHRCSYHTNVLISHVRAPGPRNICAHIHPMNVNTFHMCINMSTQVYHTRTHSTIHAHGHTHMHTHAYHTYCVHADRWTQEHTITQWKVPLLVLESMEVPLEDPTLEHLWANS